MRKWEWEATKMCYQQKKKEEVEEEEWIEKSWMKLNLEIRKRESSCHSSSRERGRMKRYWKVELRKKNKRWGEREREREREREY